MLGRHPLLLASAAAVCLSAFAQGPAPLQLSGDYAGTHDPSIAREAGHYYVFATGHAPGGGEFAVRCSDNLTDWKQCGHIFDSIPAWIREASPKTHDLWAPDISFFHGQYRLYYAYSIFGSNESGIALATNTTLDPNSPNYHWKDEGLVLRSTSSDDFNAIDPNLILDGKGQPWLSFGSFWSGIKLRRLDPETGKLSTSDTKVYDLATRKRPDGAQPFKPGTTGDWQAIEAPFIVHHGNYYYLFVAYDLCCRGTRSNYKTMVGRSNALTGPYVDATGTPMLEGGGPQLLVANERWLGPGGASILQRPEGDIIVFHAYDATTGKPALQISTLTWDGGWPHAALGTVGEAK